MTKLARRETVNSDSTVMHRGASRPYHTYGGKADWPLGAQLGVGRTRMVNVVFDRMVAVALGAILIAVGAYAINDPGAMRSHLMRSRVGSSLALTDDRVRYAGVVLVFTAALWIVAAMVVPLASAPPVSGSR